MSGSNGRWFHRIPPLCLLFILLLTGCSIDSKAEKREQEAIRYYAEKYQKTVSVVSSRKAGDSGLFGRLYVTDMAYEMSDGCMVFWNDDEQRFADNAQAEEIALALSDEIVIPAVKDCIGEEYTLTDFSFNRTGYSNFDESVYTAFFDGDIAAFTQKEKPVLQNFTLVMKDPEIPAGSDSSFKAPVKHLYDALTPCLSGDGSVIVMDSEVSGPVPDADRLSQTGGNPSVRASASLDFQDTLHWKENVFIEAMPGVRITSWENDFVLEAGDIIFEEDGSAAALQKRMDAAYDALPVDAEENEGGRFQVHDRRNVPRTVLCDEQSPVYRAVWSGRAVSAQNEYGYLTVYIIFQSDSFGENTVLWRNPDVSYELFPIAENNRQAEHSALVAPDDRYYFGEIEQEAYDGADGGD